MVVALGYNWELGWGGGGRGGRPIQNKADKQGREGGLEACIQIECMGASTGTSKCVFTHPFFEEVHLALEGDQVHPRKGVLNTEEFGLSEASQQMISHKLDILFHHVSIHTGERTEGQRFLDILHFNVNSISNDIMNDNSAGTVEQQVGVDVDCEISV